MAHITLDRVTKAYRGAAAVVEDISIDVADGEFLVLVGPSGSGKSTLLRMIAGLEEITGGEVRVEDRIVNEVPPRDRDLAMVFQNYALYPHMSVEDNMAFALKLRRVAKEERQRRVSHAAGLLGLEPYLQRKPAELSGGQRQRVAMGRAIVREPKAFLMDEPLSNLDAKLRVSMRSVLAALHERLGVTTVYVTHDQIEAMTLGDRVAVLAEGRLQQVDTPQNLFDHPANLFVAGFIGSPAMNMVEAELVRNGGIVARFGSRTIPVPDPLVTPEVERYIGRTVVLGVRPSSFAVAADGDDAVLDARVSGIEELGSEVHVMFEIDAPAVQTDATRHLTPEDTSEEEALSVRSGHSLWTARLPRGATARAGSTIAVSIETDELHFFEPTTGATLAAPPG